MALFFDRAHPGRVVTGRAAIVGDGDDVAAIGHALLLEILAWRGPHRLRGRTAIDGEDHRIFLLRIEIARLQHERIEVVAADAEMLAALGMKGGASATEGSDASFAPPRAMMIDALRTVERDCSCGRRPRAASPKVPRLKSAARLRSAAAPRRRSIRYGVDSRRRDRSIPPSTIARAPLTRISGGVPMYVSWTSSSASKRKSLGVIGVHELAARVVAFELRLAVALRHP